MVPMVKARKQTYAHINNFAYKTRAFSCKFSFKFMLTVPLPKTNNVAHQINNENSIKVRKQFESWLLLQFVVFG